MLSTLRSGFTSAVSRRAVPAARPSAEESRATLLERLYREHADRVYGLCLRMSGDTVRASELAQDVFVRAWEQLDRMKPGSDAGAWLWRLALVFVLLKRIAGLELSIVPTHPDGAGGLGFVKDMPKAFSLLAFATSAVVASRLAHDVLYHGVSLLSLKVVLGGFVVLVVVICIAPLLALARPLAAAKRRALLEYGALVGKHGRLVRQRWILGETPSDDAVLQAPEIGPVADTLALYEAVSRMRPVPFGKSTLLGIAVPTLIPILVLISTQVPIKEVLKKIVGALL